MAITITIQGTPIAFPSSSESPNWSEAIIQFALAVEAALQGVVGNFDVSPQKFILDPYNPPSLNIPLPDLSFSNADVRAAYIRYTVHRTTQSPNTEANETGMLWIVYNDQNGVWDISQEKAQNGFITFDVTPAGQVRISTTNIPGINHAGFIVYAAQTLENNS